MKRRKILMLVFLMVSMAINAQCSFRNTAFKGGEFLSYNLYYNWKFVWVKAGTASMYTVESTYKGKPAYRSSLTTRGNNKVDNMFVLRDTLLCNARSGTPVFPQGSTRGQAIHRRRSVLHLSWRQAASAPPSPAERRFASVEKHQSAELRLRYAQYLPACTLVQFGKLEEGTYGRLPHC